MRLEGMSPAELIKLCHDQAHEAAHDFEDTMMAALTKRDIWLLCMGTLIIAMKVPCLGGESVDLIERLAELLDVQMPHWRQDESGGETP